MSLTEGTVHVPAQVPRLLQAVIRSHVYVYIYTYTYTYTHINRDFTILTRLLLSMSLIVFTIIVILNIIIHTP